MSDTNLTNLIVNYLTREELHSADFTDHGDELFVQSDHAGVSVGGVGVDALDTTNITNCITHIPQDVKLEISNGSLILKAGSVYYKPNGVGVFDKYTRPSDMTYNFGSSSGVCLIYPSGGFFNVGDCVSGATDSKAGVPWHVWYDTANNSVKLYGSDGSTPAETISLPLGVVTVSSGVVTSIDQVFNGFGYIGSTVFALPGVKGLMPSGRNADGTLKNTAFTVNNVLTITTSYDFNLQCVLIMRDTGIDYVKQDFYLESETTPALKQYARLYQSTENQMYYGEASGWNKISAFNFGLMTIDSSGKITSFSTKTPFHAVDYSDYIRNPGTVVEFRAPTSANDYTWYCKYSNGWVEQGGQAICVSVADGSGSAGNNTINFPIAMENDRYQFSANTGVGGSGWDYANGVVLNARNATYIRFKVVAGTSNDLQLFWRVWGMAA